MDDVPKSLRDPAERLRRRMLLALPHVAPLATYVAELRTTKGAKYQIPDFDPLDGGIEARVLVLLEAPGARAVASGYVSRNNPDETAKNVFHAFANAGIERRDTVLWNVVPWYIGTGERIRPANARDFAEARAPTERLLSLLPKLKAVVLMGGKAKFAYERLGIQTSAL